MSRSPLDGGSGAVVCFHAEIDGPAPRPRKGGRPQRGKKFKTLSGEFLGENPFFASTAIMRKSSFRQKREKYKLNGVK